MTDVGSTDDVEENRPTMPCWDCGDEVSLRRLQRAEVMDHSGEGMGYETYEAGLCPHCFRKRIPHHECETCGREHPDLETAATCCTGGMRGPI